ncbi:MAG TPA: tRNA guanosine(34) transglycosylase Tgt [Salinivirga sp.]|uniref:tRNA guanosine(34) transglycosylase Tgt n=1 Tax=Salinivirga sp. TaxID=1970192 RepID=UPI002B4618A0|nr:tRNA guanosine(34) transglycosylase Tgt [Salinivirga sp.]HKK60479.1 tRNA guanosine(34) transglycosylase Tgt [Salinivirga sp.]
MLSFNLLSTDVRGKARAGVIRTERGEIETPIFMPVGTVGTVKGVLGPVLTDDIKAQIILGNTYHLFLRPGNDVIQKAGGLHQFMNWKRPILTDSGGFQVFSLADNRKLSDEGVTFRSHIDGGKHFFSPENVVDTQRIIGSDIMMALDECPPGDADYQYAHKSLQLTQNWLKRGHAHFEKTKPLYGKHQAWFPIVQGAGYPDLRRSAAQFVTDLGAEGNAIGGLSVGEPTDLMYEMIEVTNEVLPEDKPRYLMGVGTPANILEAIDRGVDMFDCVMPTRNGRNGMLFTSEGIINIKNKKWENDYSPVDPNGTSWVDRYYSKAYLRHLFVSRELLGPQIASVHNLAFYLWLVKTAREEIIAGNFASWKSKMVQNVAQRI